MHLRLISLLLVAAAPLASFGATVSFTCSREVEADCATLKLRRIVQVEDLQKPSDAEHLVDLTRPLPSLELAPGHWSVEVVSPAVWHQPQYFSVGQSASVVLDVWSRAFLTGRVKTPARNPPVEMIVRIEPASDASPSGDGKPCPVEEGAFRCAVPAAPVHIRLRAKGHVALYWWNTRLGPGEIRDLGELSLREGQAITGRIGLPREFRGDWSAVIVRAHPAVARTGQDPVLFKGAVLMPIACGVTEKGFFHLDGVAPGGWTVKAHLPTKRLFSEQVPVTVLNGADASLTRPLQLDRARRVEIAIQPPLDPAGNPWIVSLLREVVSGHVEPVFERPAKADGQWIADGLLPGRYSAAVQTSDGDAWHEEHFLLGSADAIFALTLQSRLVMGTVRIGNRPLRAKLTFLGQKNGTASTSSDDEGRFIIRLPHPDQRVWDVEITAEQPYVDRTVEHFEIDGSKEVAIHLPDGTVRGEVVDEAGTPVPRPLIHFVRSAGAVDVFGTEAGTFSITGLAPGVDEVQAEGRDHQWSERVVVQIPEEGEAEPLRLVVRKQKEVRGIVMSDFGPVAGATVLIRSTDVAPGLVPFRTTDANGRFVGHLPPDCAEFDLFVNAPGFSYMMDHLPFRKSLLQASVDQMGGTIVVRAKTSEIVWVVHGGAVTHARAIARDTNGSESDHEIVMRRMEPGPYSACLVGEGQRRVFRATNGAAGGRCVSGVLPPNGSLTLEIGGG
jgi:hypothetical protein